jgi:hypothetical protein
MSDHTALHRKSQKNQDIRTERLESYSVAPTVHHTKTHTQQRANHDPENMCYKPESLSLWKPCMSQKETYIDYVANLHTNSITDQSNFLCLDF